MRLISSSIAALCSSMLLATRIDAYNFDLPSTFEQTQIGSTAGGTDIEFSPTDGTMLVTTKEGKLLVFRNPGVSDDKYTGLDLGPSGMDIMCSNGERALASITLHPNWDGVNNKHIFLYYAFDKPGNQECLESGTDGPVNRFSRWDMDDEYQVDKKSEVVLFDTGPLPYDHHNSGDSFFGNDGYLYVGVGDGGSYDVSQDKSNIMGSILRINEDGTPAADNPYMNDPNVERCYEGGVVPSGNSKGVCAEIFAIGLRNPWRIPQDMNVEPPEVRFAMNDVGEIKWEEVSMGGTNYSGANYGWPDKEGPCRRTTISDCAVPTEESGYIDPFFYYQHGMQNDGAITGGTFIPKGLWGEEWDNKYLFSQFIFGDVIAVDLTEREGYDCRSCIPPLSNRVQSKFFSHDRIVHMSFGPYKDTQALYYVSRDRSINRVAYVGEANFNPVVVLNTDVVEGNAPLTVTFDSTGTTDPNAKDVLTYEWDFNDDGVVDSTQPIDTYTYTTNGLYEASLTVKDGNDGIITKTVQIQVGGLPVCTITSPPADTTFAVGDVLTVSGTGFDEEDQILDPKTSLTWEVQQHHGDHYHPFLDPIVGNDIQISAAPEPEDYFGATNSFLRVLCTATDSDGLSSTVYRDVQPKKVLIDFDTLPSGLEVKLAGAAVKTPITATSWENYDLLIEAADQTFENKKYTFLAWNDNGAQSHKINVPPASTNEEDRLSFIAGFTDGFFKYTLSPTSIPTTEKLPTLSPTMEATTASPTIAATVAATTGTPTGMPVDDPTDAPVSDPTDAPTVKPPPPTTAPVMTAEPTTAVTIQDTLPDNAVPGIEVHYFELNAEIEQLPNFDIMVPYKTEVVSSINYQDTMDEFAGSGRNKLVAAIFEGYLVFPSSTKSGERYNLYLDSDDGAKLYINNQLIIDNDISGPMGNPKKGSVTVTTTAVEIRTEYYENDGGAGLVVSWSNDNGDTMSVIPPDAYYRVPSTPVPEGLVSGIMAQYYEIDDIASLPDFDMMTPYMNEVVHDINYQETFEEFAGSGRRQRVGAVFEGYIKFPGSGEYTLSLDSDDGSKLYINDRLIVDNDIIGPMGNPVSGLVEVGDDVAFTKQLTGITQVDSTLVKIRVDFFENTGGAGLIASWKGPNDASSTPIPKSAFFHIASPTSSPTPQTTSPPQTTSSSSRNFYVMSHTVSMGFILLSSVIMGVLL